MNREDADALAARVALLRPALLDLIAVDLTNPDHDGTEWAVFVRWPWREPDVLRSVDVAQLWLGQVNA